MKVMDHMKSLPAMPYTWGTDTELQGAQTHQNTHFHLLQTRLRAAIQNCPLKKIHIGNSCNSLYCKEPKNSALPTSLPQRSAPHERDPKKIPKERPKVSLPTQALQLLPVTISATSHSPSQPLNHCTGAEHTQP